MVAPTPIAPVGGAEMERDAVRVKIRLFAGLREVAGGDLEERFEGDAVTVADLYVRLEQSQPKLGPYLPGLAIAINEEYILDDTEQLRDGDEVALIPPISGGATARGETPHVLVTAEPLDARALRDLVRTDASGGVVVFEGVVRDRHEGHAVLRLEYEAYPQMAERVMREIVRAVAEELAVHDVAVHHRTGMLEIGETSLLVAVSAEHRAEAFAAALRVVDRVKQSVPVWKKEHGPDGAIWQEGVPAHPVT